MRPISLLTGSLCSIRAVWSPRNSRRTQAPRAWQSSGSHVRLRFGSVGELDVAARVLAGSTRDGEDLVLRVPSDGGPTSLRTLLDRLVEYSLSAEEFSVHTPDLDDVFLALTGHASAEVNAR